MRIAVICNPGDTATSMLRAARSLGDAAFLVKANPDLSEAGKFRSDMSRTDEDIFQEVMAFGPTHVIVCKVDAAGAIERIKESRPEITIIYWNFDVRPDVAKFGRGQMRIAKTADLICAASSHNAPQWERSSGTRSMWMPQGCDGFEADTQLSGGDQDIDILFIGDMNHPIGREERQDIVWWLETQGRQVYLSGHVPPDKFMELVHRSRYILDMTAYPEYGPHISQRAFRVMGFGGLLLARWVRGIRELFPEWSGVQVWTDHKKLTEMLKRLDRNEAKRDEMRKLSLSWVRKHCTWEQMMREVLNTAGEH